MVYNPKVIQASMGSIFRIQCLEMDSGEVHSQWPRPPALCGDMHGPGSVTRFIGLIRVF